MTSPVLAAVSVDSLLQVLGRTHPLLVHLPLGLVLGAGVAEAGRAIQRRNRLSGFTVPGLWIGAAGAVGACVSGWFFAMEEGGGGHLFWHRWLGILVAAWLLALAWMATRAGREGSRVGLQLVPLVRIGVFVAAVLVAWVGHLGGNMVWGEDYVLQPIVAAQPDGAAAGDAGGAGAGAGSESAAGTGGAAVTGAAAASGADTDAGSPTFYATKVLPLLQDRCYQCHGNGKHKGGLALDDQEGVRGRNDQGAWIANPVNPEGSLMVVRVTLPAGNDEAMPPKGPRLTAEQVDDLRAWIKAGAKMELPAGGAGRAAGAAADVGTASAAGKVGDAGAAAAGTGVAGTKAAMQPAVDAAPAHWKALSPLPAALVEQGAALRTRGVNVAPVARSAPTFDVSVPGARGFGDGDLALLGPFADRIERLSLARTGITDAGIASIAALPNVRSLRVDHTVLTDAGIAALLAKCPRAEVVNLVGTPATDAVFAGLGGLPALKRVFVWDTKVSGAGIDAYRRAHPGVEVVIGAGVAGTSSVDGPPVTGP